MFVSARQVRLAPEAFITQSRLPEAKAIREPSGAQEAAASSAGLRVRLRRPEPSALTA